MEEESYIQYEARDAGDARRRIAEMQRENAAAWQAPDKLGQGIERLLDAAGPPDAFPAPLLAACQAATSQQTFDAEYFSSRELHQDLRDLREMERWSIVRGATKVGFLVR